MNAPQIIKTSTGEELVVITRADYEALLHAAEEAAENAADVAIYDERKAALKTEKALPADVTINILRGSSRLKALRNWRNLTQAELASAIGVSQGFLSDLEIQFAVSLQHRPVKCSRRPWMSPRSGLKP